MPTVPPTPTPKLWQKRIPTILGLSFLVVALVIGIVFIGKGGGVFAPRATPETTPKNVKLTNITDTTFTISFSTDSATSGFVKYGTEEDKLDATSADDRDQLSGTVDEYSIHHITVRNLQPGTTYYYVLGTNNGALFDNNGGVFRVKTAKRSGTPSAAKTIYGSVTTESGAPAAGAVVYIEADGAGEMSALVTNAGGWAVPLSNARTPDGNAYAVIGNETILNVMVQGATASQTAQGSVSVAQAQPVPTLVFGRGLTEAIAETNIVAPTPATVTQIPATEPTPIPLSTPIIESATTASGSATGSLLTDALNASGSANASESAQVVTVNLESQAKPVVTTEQPIIVGKAASNVKIKIEVHSDNQVQTEVTSDANGNFEVDLSELQASLEPGEHTVTYTYTDPVTGQEVTATKTFTVAPKTQNLLAQAGTPTPTPFGSGNPYPIGGATSSASASPSATPKSASGSAAATRSSKVSTTSGLPVSGAIGTTLALIFGGIFFIIAGTWSFWISSQFAKEEVKL